MKHTIHIALLCGSPITLGLMGCATQRPVTMAPPVAAPPAMAAQVQPGANNNTYDWHDVPQGQQVPINRAVFDQGGYQLYASSGETIIVPFENQNMYVMKFGKTGGDMYFVNEGGTPTLYVRDGAFLENAAAQGARWYPFPQNYAYSRPVYMGIAPTWSDYVGMGWYPGMHYYGGYWGYSPWRSGLMYAAMPGLYINIGGHPYYGWNSYHTYYRSNPTNRILVSNSRSFNYGTVRRGSSGSFGSVGRSSSRPGSSGSFGRSTGSTGSFGRNTSTGGTSAARPKFGSGSFGSGSTGSRPSFGGGSSASRPSFGSSSSSRPSSSFGSGSSGFGSSTRRSSGGSSFGSGSSGFSSSRPSSSSGSSFGRSSSGGSSFGRSSGSSFGGGRRR